jgi:hypothetical protein
VPWKTDGTAGRLCCRADRDLLFLLAPLHVSTLQKNNRLK